MILVNFEFFTSPKPCPLHTEREKQKYEFLSDAVDIINDKYGTGTIMPLRSFKADYVDLNRVGFAGDLIREKTNPTDKDHYVWCSGYSASNMVSLDWKKW